MIGFRASLSVGYSELVSRESLCVIRPLVGDLNRDTITKQGIHLLKGRFNYETIPFADIKIVTLEKRKN